MEAPAATIGSVVEELKRRRVVRAVLAYVAAVFALLQGAQPVFEGLLLPDVAFRSLVLLSLAGFPVVVALAWVYELTADGIRRTPAASSAAAALHDQRVPLRRWLQVAGIFVLAFAVAVSMAAGLGRLRYPAADDDGRVGVAIFPFRVQGADGAWSEGAADLLATALDGTAGLRVVDPWTLWRPLRPRRDAPAEPPGPESASELAARTGAHRVVLGAVVANGDRIDLTLRIYQVGRGEPITSLAVAGAADGMADVVRDAAVRVLARIWGNRPSDLPAELDFDATRSPEALKAYLAANEAFRRGQLDSANTAIDRAIELDSTFVLAIVSAVTIKSWGTFARGQAYSGFFELLDRAEALAHSVNPRTELRLEAMRASVRTDGARAYTATRRILEIDPSDLAARASLGYYERVYGWQFGAPLFAGREGAEELLRLDSTYVPSLVARAWLAIAMGDTADVHIQLERFERTDTASTLGRGWTAALRAVLADSAAFRAMLPSLVELPAAERNTVMRVLRTSIPSRGVAAYRTMTTVADPAARLQARAELARTDVLRGYAGRVAADIDAGDYRENGVHLTLQLLIVAAALAEVGEDSITAAVVGRLTDYLPADSAIAYFQTRPVWWGGWLVGAWNAAAGDTAIARRWIDAIGTLPPGGTSEDYVGALQADIEARLAARRGDIGTALERARTAYALWTIHTDNALESSPAPAMRFHLGLLHRHAGQRDSARAMFASLVPPTTWLGVLTARASFELGDMDAEAGDTAAATFHYTRALHLWEDAGPGAADWLNRTRNRLAAIITG